jgi:RHS repeat-associated protein
VQESPVCAYGSTRCYSAIERYVWDGAQILWEFRQANAGDTKDPGPTPSNGQTGHVGYVHVGGIDAPLAMIRNDTTVVLHRDHRGLYYAATNTAGGSLGGATFPWPSTNWALSQYAFYPRETHNWFGSLPMGHLDHTGLLYRRNRYLDPVSGQFTQPDPIGFAGGLNLYGYAGGDPINNSDPFGLASVWVLEEECTKDDPEPWCEDTGPHPPRDPRDREQAAETPAADVGGGGGGGDGDARGSRGAHGSRGFVACTVASANENFLDTNRAIRDEAALGAWRLASGIALGSQYVTPDGVPGLLKFGYRTLTNPLSHTPSFVIPSGARAGTLVVGRAAVQAVLVRAATAFVVGTGGFQLGVYIGSLGVGASACG